ncbi:hypothetical protein [Nocardia sp. alder85J]|nr:hypothetical protein [Nocardia sp. alder85J]MCX4094777.1 hypothetical protein [Nocardia sp. alder85J]
MAAKLENVLDLVEAHGVAEFFQIKLNRYRGIPLDRVATVARPVRYWGI